MGIFARLFGSSDRKDDVVGDRCDDCGMAGGTHTDWCPTAAAGEDQTSPGPQSNADDGASEPTDPPPLQA